MGEVDVGEYGDVWVFVEEHAGDVAKVSWELLAEARRLADDTDQDLVALVIGEDVEPVAEEAIARGADRAIFVDDPIFEPYRADPYGEQFRAVVEERKPDIVLIGGTTTGRDFAGRVAVPTHAGLTADCTKLDVDEDGMLLARRPTFGGDVLATIKCPSHRPQMATIRPGVFDAAEPDPDRQVGEAGTLEAFETVVEEEETLTRVIEREVGEVVDITDADVLVAAGAGTEGDLEPVERLVDVLDGELAASRDAVDAGWIDADRQVGQTGKTVRPELYVAVGISGAVQHVEGMEESEFVVAINNDPNAPIFDHADVGIVGDLFEVCPAIADELGEPAEVPA